MLQSRLAGLYGYNFKGKLPGTILCVNYVKLYSKILETNISKTLTVVAACSQIDKIVLETIYTFLITRYLLTNIKYFQTLKKGFLKKQERKMQIRLKEKIMKYFPISE